MELGFEKGEEEEKEADERVKERVEGFIKDRVKKLEPVARSTGPVDRRKPRPSPLQSVDRPVDRLRVKIKILYQARAGDRSGRPGLCQARSVDRAGRPVLPKN